jgi:hypothetical protein
VNYSQRTEEQIALTNFYLNKWDEIIYSTQPVDRLQAERAVVNAYQRFGLSAPKILFLTSPSSQQVSVLNSILPSDIGDFLSLKGELIDKMLEGWKAKPLASDEELYLLYSDCRKFSPSNRGGLFEKLCDLLYENTIYGSDLPNANLHKIIEDNKTNAWFYD